MNGSVAAVYALGTVLVISWFAMTALVLDWVPGKTIKRTFDDPWRKMVLGFFGWTNERSGAWWWYAIAAWFVTALLSTAGWIMGFVGALRVVESDGGLLYMDLCIAQLAVLLAWTTVVLAVHPNHTPKWIWRGLCVFLLLAAAGVYVACAAVFILSVPIGDGLSAEFSLAAKVLLCVHAAHGLGWDCALWGWSYYTYSSSSEYARVSGAGP